MYIVAALMFLMFFVPALLVLIALALLTRNVRQSVRFPLLIIASMLLLTPTWGPATIAVIPVTFVWLLVPTIITLSWPELAAWIAEFPRWHAFAFPATAVITYIFLRVRSNNSFKPNLLRSTGGMAG